MLHGIIIHTTSIYLRPYSDTRKFLITLRELPAVALSCNVKIKENLPLVGIN